MHPPLSKYFQGRTKLVSQRLWTEKWSCDDEVVHVLFRTGICTEIALAIMSTTVGLENPETLTTGRLPTAFKERQNMRETLLTLRTTHGFRKALDKPVDAGMAVPFKGSVEARTLSDIAKVDEVRHGPEAEVKAPHPQGWGYLYSFHGAL
jgi:hypothetical protein